MAEIKLDPIKHRYTIGSVEIPSVSQILDHGGFKTKYPEGNYKDRGTAVHATTVLIDQGKDKAALEWAERYQLQKPPGEYIYEYIRAYENFKKDFPEIHWSIMEKIVYKHTPSYAGMVDRFGILDNCPLIMDIKTGTPPNKRLRLQLAAYAVALNVPYCIRWGLELKDNGKYKLHICDDADDIDVWIGLAHRYNWERK